MSNLVETVVILEIVAEDTLKNAFIRVLGFEGEISEKITVIL